MNKLINKNEQWKAELMKHLPKYNLKYLKKLKSLIIFIDDGIKPAFLLDFGIMHFQAITNWIDGLKNANLISNNILTMELNGDLFIHNIFQTLYLMHTIQSINESKINGSSSNLYSPIFIDISKELSYPRIVETTESQSILKRHSSFIIDSILNFTNNEELKLKLIHKFQNNIESKNSFADFKNDYLANNQVEHQKNRLNFTTVYGLILGYPIIYWYKDSEAGASLNQLSLQRCSVIKDSVEIFSFTYPSMLSAICSEVVAKWFNEMTIKFSGLTLTCESVAHAIVNM